MTLADSIKEAATQAYTEHVLSECMRALVSLVDRTPTATELVASFEKAQAQLGTPDGRKVTRSQRRKNDDSTTTYWRERVYAYLRERGKPCHIDAVRHNVGHVKHKPQTPQYRAFYNMINRDCKRDDTPLCRVDNMQGAHYYIEE